MIEIIPPLDPIEITGTPRPPWWRFFARRRWDRTVDLGRRLYAETASRMGVLVGPAVGPAPSGPTKDPGN